MNPVVVRVGIAVVVGLAVYLFHKFKTHNRTQNPSYSAVSNSSGNFDGSNINTCCICLSDFRPLANKHEIVHLPCKHKFHRQCIKIVFHEGGTQRTCPLCRSMVDPSFISQLQ